MEIIINGRTLEGKPTGVGRYLSNLLNNWGQQYSQHKYNIFFKDEIPKDEYLKKNSITTRITSSIGMINKGPIWENIFLPLSARKVQNPDIYFSPTYTLPIIPIKAKNVVTIFDISYIAHPEWFPYSQRIQFQSLTGFTVNKADMILTGSEATKKEILKYYKVNEDKIFVTNLGVDPKFLALESNSNNIIDIKKKYNINGKMVLFVGLVLNRRNIPVLMQSVSNVIKKMGEDITLVILGKNFSYPYIDVMGEAERSGITKNLRWITYTTDEEVYSMYKSADVFVCSSLYEGFNIPPLEAMHLGVPVICSNMSSLPEVVGDAAYLLENPRDEQEMTAALEKVLGDVSLQGELRRKGIERSKLFSWEKCAKETMQYFEKLV